MDQTHTPELTQKSLALDARLRELGSLMVAYSGGTDSAFLSWAAFQVLGKSMLAEFAHTHVIPIKVITTDELLNPDYQRNDAQRCFHCKDELFSQMELERERLGFVHMAFGMNLDDRGEIRPGQRAAAIHGALAPLVDAQLTKAEIRALAAGAGLAIAAKPASACLSSRIEYGRPVTAEALSQVERAEDALRELGFFQVRVRHHGDLARVEIARNELHGALSLPALDRITLAVRNAGFTYITLDTQGYRTGSMNDILPASAIAAARTNH